MNPERESEMSQESDLSFEDAVNQLESIVQALEEGEPSLAGALAKYEAGVQLLSRCYGMLEQAERSVAVLTGFDERGNVTTAPFDATATIELEKAARGVAAASAKPTAEATPPTAPFEPTASIAPVTKTSRSRRQKPAIEPVDDPLDPPF